MYDIGGNHRNVPCFANPRISINGHFQLAFNNICHLLMVMVMRGQKTALFYPEMCDREVIRMNEPGEKARE